jgi:thioredoxin-related protein
MHKWGFCFLLLGLNGLALAQNPGEEHAFPTMSNYEKALKKAKTEGKFIFIDAYTDWCGWCKVMEKKTFSDSSVRAKMQGYANCYRLEMEKEKVGQQLKMKYGIGLFPSFLVLTADGRLHAIIGGFHEKDNWLQVLDSVYKLPTPARPNIPQEMNLNWPSFMNAFQQSNFRKNYPTDSVVFDYFKNFQWHNYTDFILAKQFAYKLPVKILDSFILHRTELNQKFGEDLTTAVINSMQNSLIMKAIENGDLPALNAAIQKYLVSNPNYKWIEFSCMVEFYKKKKNFTEMAKWIDTKVEALNSESLNEHAWFMYEECADTIILKRALVWIDESIRKSENFQNLDTKASLLFKVGRLDEADKMALRAIETGRKEEENVDATIQLRQKIQQSQGSKK